MRESTETAATVDPHTSECRRGPFGPLEMGGMFTVVKIREGLARGDYKDPGWYRQPECSAAYEWNGILPAS